MDIYTIVRSGETSYTIFVKSGNNTRKNIF
jgi:hypothetical protein